MRTERWRGDERLGKRRRETLIGAIVSHTVDIDGTGNRGLQ